MVVLRRAEARGRQRGGHRSRTAGVGDMNLFREAGIGQARCEQHTSSDSLIDDGLLFPGMMKSTR